MYALSVLSRRGRGHVVALSLVAVVCHGVAEVARRERRAAALAGWRGRVALEFADYLDTRRVCEPEPEPEPYHEPKIWRDSKGKIVTICRELRTGRNGGGCGKLRGADGSGDLDAPDFVHVGACAQGADGLPGEINAFAMFVMRGAAFYEGRAL